MRRHLGVPGAYRRSQPGVLGGKPERRGSWAAAVRGPSGYSDALKPRALSVTCASGSAPLAVGDRLCRCRYSASDHAMALRHQGLHGRDSVMVASSPLLLYRGLLRVTVRRHCATRCCTASLLPAGGVGASPLVTMCICEMNELALG